MLIEITCCFGLDCYIGSSRSGFPATCGDLVQLNFFNKVYFGQLAMKFGPIRKYGYVDLG
jgi:hypothetical protein